MGSNLHPHEAIALLLIRHDLYDFCFCIPPFFFFFFFSSYLFAIHLFDIPFFLHFLIWGNCGGWRIV